jgi:Tol biopolymer transport system component/DNA-binding winged helix-turn-helix (wHTH) protein
VGTNEIYEFGPFRICVAERVLRREDRIVPLTPKCFDTLLVLAQHGGSVVGKEELIRAVWPDSFVEEGNLSQNIFTLRKTLGGTAEGEQYIQTIPKRGYRLAVPVAESGPAGSTHQAVAAVVRDSGWALNRASRRISYVVGAVALVATTLLAARWVWPGDRFIPSPQIALLAVPNNTIGATISPDGKHIAYVSDDAEGQSLWLRETQGVGAGTRLIPPAPGHFWGASYSPDGNYLYYVFNEEAHPAEAALFRISAQGGESRKLTEDISAAPAFSPDGERIAFKRYEPNGHGYLLTATPLGADVKIIAQSDAAYPFYGYQWAADGKNIYYVEQANGSNRNAWSIREIPSAGGSAKLLMAPQPKALRSASWLNRSEILAVIPDEDSGMRQIWRVSMGGAFRRLTNGINDYSSISLTADARTLLASSVETHDSIWTAPAPGKIPAEPVRMSLPPGAYNYPAWTPDRHVVFVGQSNLWLSTADGLERKPLIPEKVTAGEPAVSADGRFVVFVSERKNSRNLWRVDIEGRNLRQVTAGQYDFHPAVSPDGKWVAYESRVPAPWTLWKAPLDGVGPPVKLVDNEGAEAGIAISPDSKLFAYRTDVGGIGIRSLDDGSLVRTMKAPSDPSDLQWTPDGKEVRYVCHKGRSAQLWSQPIAGDSPVRIPQSLPNDVLHVNWSPDGTRIVYLHREIKTDLALITNFR